MSPLSDKAVADTQCHTPLPTSSQTETTAGLVELGDGSGIRVVAEQRPDRLPPFATLWGAILANDVDSTLHVVFGLRTDKGAQLAKWSVRDNQLQLFLWHPCVNSVVQSLWATHTESKRVLYHVTQLSPECPIGWQTMNDDAVPIYCTLPQYRTRCRSTAVLLRLPHNRPLCCTCAALTLPTRPTTRCASGWRPSFPR